MFALISQKDFGEEPIKPISIQFSIKYLTALFAHN